MRAQRRVLEEIARRGPLQMWRLILAGHQVGVVARCVERGWLRYATVGPEVALDLTDKGREVLGR